MKFETHRGVLFMLLAVPAYAFSFGWDGRDGQTGPAGRNGRDGQTINVQALGASANYDLSGTDGGNGQQGEPGQSATSCQQPINATSNQEGADGGNGGNGGNGGSGGHGGSITVSFNEIENLSRLYVRSTPGSGGYSAWGGRGGEPCHCQISSWTPPTSTTTYYCQSGDRGRDGGYGSQGASGRYGSITLIQQLTPVLPEKPSADIDMSKMETTTVQLSKNLWENRTGARQLFAPGSDIVDSYRIFTGRVELSYSFRWEVPRPVTDFTGWKMSLRMEGNKPKLYLPSGLWVDGELLNEGSHYTYVFRSIVSTSELGNLQIASYSGYGSEHTIVVKDSAEVSNILTTSVKLQYFAYENGNYKPLFDAVVPDAAITADAKGFQIAMGKLGLDEKYLGLGTQAYAGLTITRTLGSNSAKYQLGGYYTIQITYQPGDSVEVTEDSNLLTGNTVVGNVKKGERFLVNKIQDVWIALKKADGTTLPGWIQKHKLKPAQP